MVRELRELIELLISIDTTVDIDDIKAVAQFNPDTDRNISELKDILTQLNIKPTIIAIPGVAVPELVVAQDVSGTEPQSVIPTNNCQFPELVGTGVTNENLQELYKLYQARKITKKMSFEVCIKCCKFVADKIAGSKTRLQKTKVVPLLTEYLKIIDPTTQYNVCNIHDFLKGSSFGNISSRFFKFKDGYLLKP